MIHIAISLIMLVSGVFAARQSSVSRYGITWYFDAEYEVGQFVNGDWWVAGPVVTDSITPHMDIDSTIADTSGGDTSYTYSVRHGWEVNPHATSLRATGFDSRHQWFNRTLVPSLPYTATG